MQSILTQETIIIALIYLSLSVLYLLVIPAVIYYYLKYALVCGFFLGKRVYVLSDELFLPWDAVVKSFP